jgi:hypothetical protein
MVQPLYIQVYVYDSLSGYWGEKRNIEIANRLLENVAELKYFGTMLTNKICIHKEMKYIKFGELFNNISSESFVFPFAV